MSIYFFIQGKLLENISFGDFSLNYDVQFEVISVCCEFYSITNFIRSNCGIKRCFYFQWRDISIIINYARYGPKTWSKCPKHGWKPGDRRRREIYQRDSWNQESTIQCKLKKIFPLLLSLKILNAFFSKLCFQRWFAIGSRLMISYLKTLRRIFYSPF